MILRSLALLLLGSSLGAIPAAAPAHAQPVRGITLSTHTDGTDWSRPGVATAMDDMVAIGANWVTIHPYAGIRNDGTVRFWAMPPGAAPDWIRKPIEAAHARGLKILIKPHLAYWGSKFSWRGDIAFRNDEEWTRFWDGYRRWIVAVAEACADADAFAVGTELDAMLGDGHEREWRELIADVRAVTDMPLTYAANWADYEQVPFWDDLDVIGIQAYFPLADSVTADPAVIEAGWERWMDRMAELSDRWDRPIVFTELGYNRAHDAAVEPWSYRVDGSDAEAVQALCLRLSLEAVEREPAVLGSFLWKWFPNPHPVGRNFQLATPVLLETIRGVWLPRTEPALTD